MLRLANSPMYARHRESSNLEQALLVLGLNAAISLALSFSLLKSWQADEADEGGLDYPLFWRRALIGATAAQTIADRIGIRETGELFLTTLIQDIGVMALDRAMSDLYVGLGAEQVHEKAMIELEQVQLGTDHAEVGAWLLEKWNFPARIREAIQNSHLIYRRWPTIDEDPFTCAVAFGTACAEVFLEEPGERRFEWLGERARESLNMDAEQLQELLAEITAQMADAEALFDTKLVGKNTCDAIQEQAREALMMRSLSALQEVDHLQVQARSLEERTSKLEESSRRDSLTGLYNRAFLDEFVDQAFESSDVKSSPLSIAFADLDRFKSVNDTYGHGTGDQILRTTADLLKAQVRSSDVVARYGGEEFVLVFPGTDSMTVRKICERIVEKLRAVGHDVGQPTDLNVTISIGVATHNDGTQFEDGNALISAADEALYSAKLTGRDRTVPFDTMPKKQNAGA